MLFIPLSTQAVYTKPPFQNVYLFTTPWALENEKLRHCRYTRAQMQFKSSYHQIPALSRLAIDGLSPTLSIMTAGINIDWWAVIMEWLIICSQFGFGPINEAFFTEWDRSPHSSFSHFLHLCAPFLHNSGQISRWSNVGRCNDFSCQLQKWYNDLFMLYLFHILWLLVIALWDWTKSNECQSFCG